jgi:Tol biopolymer transport system component/DNA-binding winged helix-turn-helix (wHTH) protein
MRPRRRQVCYHRAFRGASMNETVPDPAESLRREPFWLGEWLVEPALNRIGRQTEARQVEPRVMDVLVRLASRPGEVFTREELLEKIWIDVVVGEEALTRAISELRRALDDDHRSPRFVETIRKGGYRLLAAPRPAELTPGAASSVNGTQGVWSKTVVWVATIVVATIASATAWITLRGDGDPAEPPAVTTVLEAIPLTALPGQEEFPAISPDGRHVAFAWSGGNGGNIDIYVRQIGTESLLRLTEDPGVDTYPRWSADGSLITFLHAEGSGEEIRTVPLIGGRPRKLLDVRGDCGGYDWSPDGAVLVYSESGEHGMPMRLHLLDKETSERLPVGDPLGEMEGDIAPAFSPDGKSVAFVRVDGSGLQDIFLLSVADGAVRRLTHGLLQVRGVAWERDGRSLICSAVSSAFYFLWRVDVRNGSMTRLPTRSEWVHYPTVAHHADRLVYQDIYFDKNIWRIQREEDPAQGLSTDVLIASTRWDCEAAFSADGKHVAFTSARSGNLEIWVASADGSDPYRVTESGGLNVGNPRWSPDGKRIAFHAGAMNFPSLFVVDTRGGRPRRLTDGEHNHFMSSWSRDGRWLYFGSDREGTWNLWKLPVDQAGGEAVRVTWNGGIAGYESLDGESLYFTKPDRAGLWRMDLQGDGAPAEPERIMVDLPQQGDWANWGMADTGVVLVRREPEGPMIVFYDFSSGESVPVSRVPNIATPSLNVSPDGRTILYARLESSDSDVMLVDGYR